MPHSTAGLHRCHSRSKKELVGLIDHVRESAQSRRKLLLDLKWRGRDGPKLAVLDDALRFWQAVEDYGLRSAAGAARLHKTANAPNRESNRQKLGTKFF
jgi:transposase-like protein